LIRVGSTTSGASLGRSEWTPHNPNLAVVCDADQIIHCNIDKQNRNTVTYTSGSLENPEINKFTVDVLEGTRPAFDHGDSKYSDSQTV